MVLPFLFLACAPSSVAAADRVAADAAVRDDDRRVPPLIPVEPTGSVATLPDGRDDVPLLERRDLKATKSVHEKLPWL